jgi:hypothetical protein
MMENGKIRTGDPVILKDNTGLESLGIENGTKGWANSITTVPDPTTGSVDTFVFFMPVDGKEMYITFLDRVEFDKERAGLELDAETIYKG